MPRTEERERQQALPPVVQNIDELMTELEAWRPPDPNATEDVRHADEVERQALERALQVLLEQAGPQVEQLASSLHAWLRRLTAEHEAAKAEVQRAQFWAGVRGRKVDRVKRYLMDVMRALRVDRLEGPTWRLRLQANGGRTPITRVSKDPVPPCFAREVSVDPQKLVNALRQIAPASRFSDHDMLKLLGVQPEQLEPDLTKVYRYLENNGDLPAGFETVPKGQHLRVE